MDHLGQSIDIFVLVLQDIQFNILLGLVQHDSSGILGLLWPLALDDLFLVCG